MVVLGKADERRLSGLSHVGGGVSATPDLQMCGNALQIIGALFYRQRGRGLRDYFQMAISQRNHVLPLRSRFQG